MDHWLERLAREERQNELCRLRSDNARLRLAILRLVAEIHIRPLGLLTEPEKRLRKVRNAAEDLLKELEPERKLDDT